MVDEAEKGKQPTMSSGKLPNAQDREWIHQSIANMRVLLLDGLLAGKYLAPDATWRPHHTGEILYFADRMLGDERPAVLVLAEELTNPIVAESVESDFRSYVLVGGTLKSDVDLGKSRHARVGRASSLEEHYWGAFVLDGAILVTLGTPLSWCRMVGEILNAQMTTPFVQSRICSNCHALNAYRSTICQRCNRPLTATGRIG